MIICNRRRNEKHKQHKENEIIVKMLRNWSCRKREVKEDEEKEGKPDKVKRKLNEWKVK